LNLLRGGSDPAINYYGLVRPQIDFYNGIQGLQQQVSNLDYAAAAQAQGLPGGLGPTGHPAMFFNYSHYYPGLGVGRTGLGGPGLAGPLSGGGRPLSSALPRLGTGYGGAVPGGMGAAGAVRPTVPR
jgi:hypothetical protein